MITDILTKTLSWFQKAVPEPASKNAHTQLGCHFEEINETLMAVSTTDFQTQIHLDAAKAAIAGLANHLKTHDHVVFIAPADREEFLDGLCDQIVTATGVAHMFRLDILGGLTEVNRSNWSKFDANANPIFNDNMKVMKGPAYSKPDLSIFI
jgi:hypothetical protein